VKTIHADRRERTGWEDLRSIVLLLPIVAGATGAAWLISRELGATIDVATAITATAALGTALLLESQRRKDVNFLMPSGEVQSWGPFTAFPADGDLNRLLLDEAWTAHVARNLVQTLTQNLRFEAIVWLSGKPDSAASYAYPLHRGVEELLGRTLQAVFINEVVLDFDDMTVMAGLSRESPILLVQITGNGKELMSRANRQIENRTRAYVGGYFTLFEKPEVSQAR